MNEWNEVVKVGQTIIILWLNALILYISSFMHTFFVVKLSKFSSNRFLHGIVFYDDAAASVGGYIREEILIINKSFSWFTHSVIH